MNRAMGIALACLLGCGIAVCQQQSSGTVNTLSVDPQQNQKLSGSMGTETGQPNDVSRGADRSAQTGNPADRPVSGQVSSGSSPSTQAPGGSRTANQKSSSTNSGKAKRRQDTTYNGSGAAGTGAQQPQSNTPH